MRDSRASVHKKPLGKLLEAKIPRSSVSGEIQVQENGKIGLEKRERIREKEPAAHR